MLVCFNINFWYLVPDGRVRFVHQIDSRTLVRLISISGAARY